MDTQQKLNYSSPIVQRVLRLRERRSEYAAATEKVQTLPGKSSDVVDTAQARTNYNWQMWQKSDASAYAGDGSEHRCKGVSLLLTVGREEDCVKVQAEVVLSSERSF